MAAVLDSKELFDVGEGLGNGQNGLDRMWILSGLVKNL